MSGGSIFQIVNSALDEVVLSTVDIIIATVLLMRSSVPRYLFSFAGLQTATLYRRRSLTITSCNQFITQLRPMTPLQQYNAVAAFALYLSSNSLS